MRVLTGPIARDSGGERATRASRGVELKNLRHRRVVQSMLLGQSTFLGQDTGQRRYAETNAGGRNKRQRTAEWERGMSPVQP